MTKDVTEKDMQVKAARNEQGKSAKQHFEKNLRLFPLVVLCGLVVAAVMAFGNPALWISEEQSFAHNLPADVRQEDSPSSLPDNSDFTQDLVVLGEYRSTALDNTSNYTSNIALAAQTLDGYEVKPGQTISFNEIVGDVSRNSSYKEAQDTEGYETKDIAGGGLGQVATALHIAALKSDCEIVERHAYLVLQSYAPLAFDARVSFGEADLKIKNTSDTSLYIRTASSGSTVEVKLYGKAKNDGVRIDTGSEIIETKSQPLSELLDNPVATGDVELSTINAYRIYYQDESPVDTELLYTETYVSSLL